MSILFTPLTAALIIGLLTGILVVVLRYKYRFDISLSKVLFIFLIAGSITGVIINDMYASFIGIILALAFYVPNKALIKITSGVVLIMLSTIFIVGFGINMLSLTGLFSMMAFILGIARVVETVRRKV
ncbi:MAG TPA: hypothetical protein VNL13_00075 [Sulfolobales archaeon]|nr:hypothetical protein [Sulfolobales archaeon]